MLAPQPVLVDWRLHLSWLSQALVKMDARLQPATEAQLDQMGNQLTELALLHRLCVTFKSARWRFSWLLNQLLYNMGLKADGWQTQPRIALLPMVGLHAVEGVCLVTEPGADKTHWACQHPKGKITIDSSDDHWLFSPVTLGWSGEFRVGVLGLPLSLMRLHAHAIAQLFALTWLIHGSIGLFCLYLIRDWPLPMRQLGLKEMVGLLLVMAVVVALHQVLQFGRARWVQHQLDLAAQQDHPAWQVPIMQFMFSGVVFLMLDFPLVLLFGWGIWIIGSPLLTVLPFSYITLKVGLSIRTFANAQKFVPLPVIGLPSEDTHERHGRSDAARGLGISHWLKQRLNAFDQHQMKLNHRYQRFAIQSLHDNHGLREISCIAWLMISVIVATDANPMSLGVWLACGTLTLWIINPVNRLPLIAIQWLQATWILQSKNRQDPTVQTSSASAPLVSLQKGQLLLRQIHYTRPGQLHDLRIDQWQAHPGERIAIVGDLGSGKSTLLKLMAGLLKPDTGDVHMDHMDAHTCSDQLLSNEVAYLDQRVTALPGTLRENLLAGKTGIHDDVLLDLCQKIGLMPLINAHDAGLSMPLSDALQSVSAGQLQLIGLARLFLRQPRIWLLDDPLVHLSDPLRIKLTHLMSERIQADQTLIFISHHPEMLSLADRIVVLGAGRLLMDGPSDQILPEWEARWQRQQMKGITYK